MKNGFIKEKIDNGILFEIKGVDKTDISLWRECFFDSEDDIKKALFALHSCAFCASLSIDGVIASQFVGVESTLCGKKGIYIYALCTAKEFRGRGYMKLLLESAFGYAKGLGYDFLWLFPASEELARSYKKLGFSVPIEVGASPVLSSDEDFFLSTDALLDLLPFEGDYEKLYGLSSRIFSFDAFKYALDCITPFVSVSYILKNGRCDGYIISKEGSKRLLAASENYREFIKHEKRSFAYIMPIREFEPCGILAEPILR